MMDIHRNVVFLLLLVFVFLFNEFSTAEKPVPTYNGQKDIVIQPPSGAVNGETFLQGIILPNAKVKVIVDLKEVQNASFLIFQVHGYIQPLLLSSAVSSEAHNSVNGTDIGLYTKLIPGTVNGTVEYIISNPNNVTVDCMLVPMFYSSEDPIPGGCNLSFLVNIAPFMTLTFDPTNDIVQVDAQAASALTEGNCQPSELAYEVYEFYTSGITADAYFKAIRSVITADKAAYNGLSSPSSPHQPELRRRFAGYPKFGSVYVVTVRNVKTGKSSAYVPISNYNCIVGNGDNCAYYSNMVAVVCIYAVASLVYIISECRYIIGKDMMYVTRLLFMTASAVILSPLLPPYLGAFLIFSFSAGMPIILCKPDNELGNSSCIARSYRFIVDCFYAMVPAHILFSIAVPVILNCLFSRMPVDFQNRFTMVFIFMALYLLYFCVYHQNPRHGIDPLCGNFFVTLLISFAANGVIAQVFMDPARILQSDFSDVMFYPPISVLDKILIPLWIFLSLSYRPLRKRLRGAFSSGEYQEIVNDGPQASRGYNTV